MSVARLEQTMCDGFGVGSYANTCGFLRPSAWNTMAFKDMLEQQKSKEKQRVGKKKQETPRGRAPYPCTPTQPPRSSGSRTTSTPPSLPRIHQPGNENNKKASRANTNTRPPSLHHSHCCRSGVVACAPISKKETSASPRYRPLLHGITSCAALPVPERPREPP